MYIWVRLGKWLVFTDNEEDKRCQDWQPTKWFANGNNIAVTWSVKERGTHWLILAKFSNKSIMAMKGRVAYNLIALTKWNERNGFVV